MQISSRVTIAVQRFACIRVFGGERKVTSELWASSVNVNPVVIRRLLRQLKSAGLIDVARGSGGASMARPAGDITLLDIYRAVECVGQGRLFRFHERPNTLCPVGRNIHNVLDGKLEEIQSAMESQMAQTTLEEVLQNTLACIENETK